jgi:hypothetical protein
VRREPMAVKEQRKIMCVSSLTSPLAQRHTRCALEAPTLSCDEAARAAADAAPAARTPCRLHAPRHRGAAARRRGDGRPPPRRPAESGGHSAGG